MNLTMLRLMFVMCRPMYSTIWFTLWFAGAIFMVWAAIYGSGINWVGWPLAMINLLFGMLVAPVTTAIVGPRGVRRAIPWSPWIPWDTISGLEIGTEKLPQCVVAVMADDTRRVLLAFGPAGYFGVANRLERSRQQIEAPWSDWIDG